MSKSKQAGASRVSAPGRLILDDPQPGAWNMAVDEFLLQSSGDTGTPTLRIYAWSAPTLSLGYFQAYEDRQRHPPSAGCPVVRRSSGGGAIVHDDEWTYSLVLPLGDRWSEAASAMYDAVHETLVEWLRELGLVGHLHASDASRCQAPSDAPCPFLCFQRRSVGDLIVGDDKIAGSAQRRFRGAVLQHGSILVGRSAAAPELAGIVELGGQRPGRAEIVQGWIPRLESRLDLCFEENPLAANERNAIDSQVSTKYGNLTWTQRR